MVPVQNFNLNAGRVTRSQYQYTLQSADLEALYAKAPEIAARMMEEAFDYLDAPVARVSGKDVPMPYAANLEKLALPSVAEVVEAAKAVCYR